MRDDERQRREARRNLERLGKEGGVMGSPLLEAKARSVKDHFQARDADQSDPIEVSATRTGRLLSILAFVLLAAWLLSALDIF